MSSHPMSQGGYARSAKSLLGALAMIGLFAAGCAGLRATNAPLEQIDPHSGYRPQRVVGASPIWPRPADPGSRSTPRTSRWERPSRSFSLTSI